MMKTKTKNYKDLVKHLENRADIKVAINQMRAELDATLSSKTECQQEAHELNMRLQQRRAAHERFPEYLGKTSESSSQELDELNDELRGKQEEVARAEQTAKILNQKIQDLSAHPLYLGDIGADAVLVHQNALIKVEAEVARLQDIIAEHQTKIEQANNYNDPVAPLRQQREETLAAVAVGDAEEKDIDAIDKQIADTSKKTGKVREDASRAIAESISTINGLNRRLEKANFELDRLQLLKTDVMLNYLFSMAEGIGRDYVENAARLVENHNRLAGINLMIAGYEQKAKFITNTEEPRIPMFARLKACADFNTKPGRSSDLYESELARLEEQGITL